MINLKIARIKHYQSIQWKYSCKVVIIFQRFNVYNIDQSDSFQSINNRYIKVYFDDDDVNNADWKSITSYLWKKISRQTKCQFIIDYKLIIKICTCYLLMWILSDHVNNNSSSWSNIKKEWLDEKMREAWKKIANHLNKKSSHKHFKVKNISMKTEIQKITRLNLSLQIRFILSKCMISLKRDDWVYWVKYKS